ncbi:MAG: fused MFS/spermidine synthase [Myxococcota bacterium]|nr:fused MFS/spermidine synthase [Myxococcota bacterium]
MRSLLALAILSGAAAVIYEVVWMRWFRLLFGNTAYAASATLCAFFAGLAIGSAWFGRIAGRVRRPLFLYGWVELSAAAAALLVPAALLLYDPIYAVLYDQFAEGRMIFVAVKFALGLAAMLPSAILLGGTLPLLATAYVGEGGSLGREGGSLYAANVLGGGLGAALGGLLLPGIVGVSATYAVGLAAAGAAAATAFVLARRYPAPAAPAPARDGRQSAAPGTLAIAFASGFGVLAFQVLLIQAVGQFFAHTVYTFGAVLVVVLVTLSAGAAFVSATERRLPVGALLSAALLVEAGLLLSLPWMAVQAQQLVASGASTQLLGDSPVVAGVIAIACLGVPALLAASLVFPLTFRLAGSGPAGPRLGGLLAANTVGGIAGSLAASFVLLEVLGLWNSLAALGLLYGAASLLAAGNARGRALRATVLAAIAGSVALTSMNPWRLPLVHLRPGERVLATAEGAHGIVSVVERSDGNRMIKIDSHYQFGDTSEQRLYERMGHLPLLLHPDPKHVLVVGSASGGLAASAVQHPVESIGLVEIVPEVQELAAEYFAASNRGVHGDPRTRLITEDGRNHLRAAGERYDVIIEDLYVPRRPSAAAMYSREHYRDVRDHLTENGIFCQWLAVYQLSETQLGIIAETFAEVFPEATLWRPYFRPHLPILALVGSAGPLPTARQVEARAGELRAGGVDDPWITDPEGVWTFYMGPIATLREGLPSPGRHTDDLPVFEFVSARVPSNVLWAFRFQGFPRLTAEVTSRLEESDPAFPGRPLAGPLAGEALSRANLAAVQGQPEQLSTAWARVRELVPARLLAQRDPSVSSYWPAPRRMHTLDPRRRKGSPAPGGFDGDDRK